MTKFPDKIVLNRATNIRYARQNFTNLVHTSARFEGVNTTLSQTQTIIDGMAVSDVSLADINVIVDLKRAWQFVTETAEPVTLAFAQKVNRIVAAHDSLAPGEFRTGRGAVTLGLDEQFIPELVDETKENQFLHELFNADISTTDKALTLMFHLMRGQLFWDGNKRTATLVANKVMIDDGAGLINVPLDHWEEYNNQIASFYHTGELGPIKAWAYDIAVQVPQI
ncbi:hypothetical protein FC62_GL000980 [Amylolactobacillus amylotrophicus DSM 20534]|uniref:Filamentation induced by cAMP protein fic n=3 Tax=Amylolactobacillus TaxID=2767876 RepID=A0A1L6XBR1_9LACO|nr:MULTISPECIES: Fic family protein [Amylolactobacillus]APT18416.1 filamentation induced by cAMP protein fic [Amylolactobacillus amylophilus DSM 20533 = JCM 1125]KRK38201.1 hypothetical protein FC62_GL000980 [Amylolactobacillus amylotrophicus DSM 20534]KRM43157.1 hypothetical protein FD40_GL000165 [Amylolactobacillus amylophilus DSM 20533 = JCM 1125]GED80444.1 hypothetical protein LAM01_09170 [Amylolactobacillus amylophilus]